MLDQFRNKLREEGEIYLKVKIRSGTAKTVLRGVMADGTIKIDIKEKPIEGKANIGLIGFLAKEFVILRKNVKIKSGASDKFKLVYIAKE